MIVDKVRALSVGGPAVNAGVMRLYVPAERLCPSLDTS